MSGYLTPNSNHKRPWTPTNDTNAVQQGWVSPSKRVHRVQDVGYEAHLNVPLTDSQSASYLSALQTYDDFNYGFLTPGSSTMGQERHSTSDAGSLALSDAGDYGWTNGHDANSMGQNFDASVEEICFGMVPDVQMRLQKGFDPLLAVRGAQGDSGHATFGLNFFEGRCDIVLASGQVAAVLNMKSFRSLQRLQQETSIRLTGSSRPASWLQQTTTSEKDADTRYCSLDILIFGYRHEADLVASKLGTEGLYLQDPDNLPEGFVYENPQYLDLPIPNYVQPLLMDHSVSRSELPTREAMLVPDLNVPPDDEFELDFDKLLDTFACHDDLSQAAAVVQVSAELYGHQKAGLDFILQRESIIVPPSRTLWERQESFQAENGSPVYNHLITGAKSPYAKECPGGIIADEMGLGKSLTMLSAITGTLDRACAYAQSMTSIGSSGQGVIAAKSTLILVPSALLIDSWIKEIKDRIAPGALTHHKFHGRDRKIDCLTLLQKDIVFTTYGTVAADYSRKRSLLHQVHWYRIVLDEAHVIRNASTKQFRAVTTLQSPLRWGLTGTPIQNSLDDLGSLARFLKVPILEDATQFKRHITGPIERKKEDTPKDYRNLRTLLQAICLRRTKAVLPMAEVTTYTHWLDFSPSEQAEYAQIERTCKEALGLAVSGHKVKEAHQNVLEILLRLRLFCNNGSIYDRSSAPSGGGTKDAEESLSLLQQSGDAVCYYCSCDITSLPRSDTNDTAILTACQHVVCPDCVPIWRSAVSKQTLCPICKSAHSMDTAVRQNDANIPSFDNYPSKILALVNDIQTHKAEGKCVVFSFWKRSLDIAGALLTAKKVPYLRVDGSLLFSKRKTVLSQFETQPEIPVLLMTLGTGAVGLNCLTVAHRIHLLEPQWNPSVESQAIGRVVRLGQERPVTVIRYIMNKTVEKNVQNRQFRKLRLAHGGFTRGKGEDVKARMQVLQDLILDQ
ncbi:Nn.00g018250.m01.CDS01 [Neocucurbitaria sp. VM-36]